MQIKKLITMTCLLTGIGLLNGCKKDAPVHYDTVSLNVTDVSPNVAVALVRTPNVTGYYAQLAGVNFASNYVFTIPAGSPQVTVVNSSDTILKPPLFSGSISGKAGDIYSMFIAGANGNDIIINKDIIPIYQDSSIGVRFINLSDNSTPVNVTLATSPTANEFASIAYKTLTDFKTYSATATALSDYTFQVTDNSGNLLATTDVFPNQILKRSITIVLMGDVAAGPMLFTVNNF